jgi:hypothetical protein
LELFIIIKDFLEKNEINCRNCVGICTDGVQSTFGRNAELQALVRKKAPHITWTHCVLHRQALASRIICEKPETVFQAGRVVNYVRNGPLRRRPFAK